LRESDLDLLAHECLERGVVEAVQPRLEVRVIQVGTDDALGAGVGQRVAGAAGSREELLAVGEVGLARTGHP
jgi:hypothetical protein